jgi:hypothetical protein
MAGRLVTMSAEEFDRVEVIRRILEGRLSQVKAAVQLDLSSRQVRRLCREYQESGPAGLTSRKRGSPSNHRLPAELEDRAVRLVRERYADFGPTLANEKLLELHGLQVGKETLRKWMIRSGLWLPRDQLSTRCASAEAPSRLPRRAGADRRQPARMVRGARREVHAAGVRR